MTYYNHSAVLKAYPNVTFIEDNYGAFDADGNPVELDQALLDATAIEVEAEAVMRRLREKRNELLAETDWWAMSDLTMTAEQTAYRQALRDLPANTTDPSNPVWPTKP